MADTDAGFLIDGKRYELPNMGTFTINESRVFYRETGLVPEVVRMRLADGTLTYMDLLENIGFLPALATIAYTREHDDADGIMVEKVIGSTHRDDLFMALLDTPEQEENPTLAAETRPPPGPSPNGSNESKPSNEPTPPGSGTSSTPSSETPDDRPGTIGTTGWDTLHMSAPDRSVT